MNVINRLICFKFYKCSNIRNKNDIQLTEEAKWFETKGSGFFVYYYEGHDVSEYKLPSPYVTIYVCSKSNCLRGTALAIHWQGKTPYTWVCSSQDGWGEWVKLY